MTKKAATSRKASPSRLEELRRKAARARIQLEEKRVDSVKLAQLYEKYNSINNVQQFVRQAQRNFPQLSCGVASVYLKHLLKRGEIINGSYKNESHTFVLIGRAIVVDITADQYGGPRVYVGPLKYPWSVASRMLVSSGS